MKTQTIVLGFVAILVCSSLMMSGCMQQNNSSNQPPSNETLQQILNKAETIKSVYYEIYSSTTMNGTMKNISIPNTTVKIWQKAPYLKEVTIIGNSTTNMTVVKRPDGTYQFDPVEHKYKLLVIPITPQPFTGDIAKDLLDNQTLKIFGNETIDGKTAIVIQYSSNRSGNFGENLSNFSITQTMKMWIWKEHGVPLKTILTMTKGGIMTTIDSQYKNYSFSDIPDGTFNVS